jgi:hypothetical protein
MGLFSFLKKKQPTGVSPITDFRSYYLYGFTDNPFLQPNDAGAFNQLYAKVIGDMGGLIISGSFHPYQIVNQKGTTVWHVAYLHVHFNENKEEAFRAITREQARFLVDPSDSFKNIFTWPDKRLTFETDPFFSKYVPFIIPFLVYKPQKKLNWDLEIQKEMNQKGHAGDYVESITESIRFFMPKPAFILGFDEFDEQNPSKMIDNFISCKSLFR